MLLMLLGDTVTEVCASPRNLTWFTRSFLLVRGRGLEMRLQATMHYLLHICEHMFRAIWEFARSRDCVAHSRNPETAQAISGLHNTCAQSRDCITPVRNLEIA